MLVCSYWSVSSSILSSALYPVLCKSKSAEHMYHGWHEVRKQLLVLSELTVIELQLILHVHKYECIMATAPVGNTSWPQHQWGIHHGPSTSGEYIMAPVPVESHHGHITSGSYNILSKRILNGLAVLTQLYVFITSHQLMTGHVQHMHVLPLPMDC